MIRGEIRCVSFSSLTCSGSPAVSKVSKPRSGHPLVEFVIESGMDS